MGGGVGVGGGVGGGAAGWVGLSLPQTTSTANSSNATTQFNKQNLKTVPNLTGIDIIGIRDNRPGEELILGELAHLSE